MQQWICRQQLINMSTYRYKTIYDILVYCVRKNPSQMTTIYGCFDHILMYCFKRHPKEINSLKSCLDARKSEVEEQSYSQTYKEMTEGMISDTFLLVVDYYTTLVLAFIGILLNILGCCQLPQEGASRQQDHIGKCHSPNKQTLSE